MQLVGDTTLIFT